MFAINRFNMVGHDFFDDEMIRVCVNVLFVSVEIDKLNCCLQFHVCDVSC